MASLAVALVAACSAEESSSLATGGGETEVTIPDAGRDAHPPVFAPDASGCRPGNVDTYQPAPYHFASAAWQGACRSGSFGQDPISGYYSACLGGQASRSACDSFLQDPSNARCAKCILTSDMATNYGPLIDHGTFITTNVAGCLELTDPMAISCAKSVQALAGCELYACEANCPVRDQASRMVYDQCASQADRFGCASYARSAACLGSIPDSGQVGKCQASTFYEFYINVVPLFCGTSPPGLEGGSLPAFDASIDVVSGASIDASIDARYTGDAKAGADARPDAATDAPHD